MQRIVNQALKRYSEDRIGMVDYALESGGVCALYPLPSPHAGWPSSICRGGHGARPVGLEISTKHNKGK